jgi:uncharacterized Rossmann fold enzyme
MVVAAHLHNRTLRRGTCRTPMTDLLQSPGDRQHVRVFGCPAYVHVHGDNRANNAAPTHVVVSMGYSTDSPTMPVYYANTRSVLASRSVCFHEL